MYEKKLFIRRLFMHFFFEKNTKIHENSPTTYYLVNFFSHRIQFFFPKCQGKYKCQECYDKRRFAGNQKANGLLFPV